MKIIQVQALARPGFPNRCRAHRFWPSGETVSVEVLDQEVDFKTEHPDGSVTFDPETSIEVETVNATTGRKEKVRRANPTRIGQSAYREILGDQVLRVVEGGAVQAELSQAALDAARHKAAEHAAEAADLAAKNATLEAKVAELQAALDAARSAQSAADTSGDQAEQSGGKRGKK